MKGRKPLIPTFTPAKENAAAMRSEEEKELQAALEALSARVGLTPAA